MVVIADGRVLASGPIEDVFGRIDLGVATGRHEAGALLAATVVDHDREFALTRLRVGTADMVVPMLEREPGAKVRLRVRARDVTIALETPSASSIRNVLAAEVVTVQLEPGAYAEILLRAEGQHLRARITRKSAAELGLAPGLRVFALIKSIAIEADRGPPAPT